MCDKGRRLSGIWQTLRLTMTGVAALAFRCALQRLNGRQHFAIRTERHSDSRGAPFSDFVSVFQRPTIKPGLLVLLSLQRGGGLDRCRR